MRLLVIDDDERLRRFLGRAFEAEGFTVDAVGDLDEGLGLALEGGHDILVLDLPPGRDGIDFLREVHLSRATLPILVLSSRSDLASKLLAFELGASDYLVKPFSLDELLARARVALRRTYGAAPGAVLRAGPLSLDVARRQATLEDHVADLSDREFRLLHFMMLHAGEVVSRERLLAEVWGQAEPARSNVVEASVRRLRRQLGAQAPIQTVRRVGYRLAG